MARRVTKNTITAIVAALLLVLVAPWLVPAGAYRTRIESSLSNALGRAVTVGAVHFRLLPRPGLSFSNLTIGEDPAFGAESMLFAAEVSADLRLAALGQGRLEFSSLSLRDASFNLVRRDDGEWNVQSLMARASRAAPAGRTAEARPRFPYLEATLSRVNFKYGIEKKAFALADADFALWMEPGAQAAWHGRLRARPMRADANLSDTGILTAQATFVRTPGGTPQLLMEAAWEEAQLGQSSALFFGRDRGWRGSAAADLAMAGPLDSLALTARFSVNDFHRYDIRPAESLRLAAVCTAKFLASTATLAGLGCKAASGDGAITVRGDIRNLFGPRNYRLRASAEEVPLERLVAFARNAKKDLPADLTAEGNLTGELSLVTDSIGGALVVSGSGIARQLTLRSAASETTLPLEAIAFDFGSSALESQMQSSPLYRLTARPFAVPLGANSPAEASAVFDGRGYRVGLSGPARLPQLQAIARLLGMRPPAYAMQGSADLHLQIAGVWSGFAPPQVTGSAALSEVSSDALGVAAPLRINSARLLLAPTEVRLENLALTLGVNGPHITGFIWLPRGCAHPEDCEARFALRSSALSIDELNRLLKPRVLTQPWYSFADPPTARSVLARVRARGQLSCARLSLRSLQASDVSAAVMLDSGHVRLSDLRATVLAGHHRGEWLADFTTVPPHYSGSGALQRASMAQLAAIMGDGWAEGLAGAKYQLRFAGANSNEMLISATAESDFTWQNGVLKHLAIGQAPAPARTAGLRFAQFAGHLSLNNGNLRFAQSRILTSSGIYEISGTATLERALALTLRERRKTAQRYSVTGTLDAPHVAAETNTASTAGAGIAR